jgi:hypothetical protein
MTRLGANWLQSFWSGKNTASLVGAYSIRLVARSGVLAEYDIHPRGTRNQIRINWFCKQVYPVCTTTRVPYGAHWYSWLDTSTGKFTQPWLAA